MSGSRPDGPQRPEQTRDLPSALESGSASANGRSSGDPRTAIRSAAIFASAGTGKTYRLSSRYLSLLARGVPASRILAVTFTRKAAHEIFDRVLERLVSAVDGESERATLSAALGTGPLARSRCVELLGMMLRSVDRLRIRTLDAFTAELATAFEHTLSLPPGWRIIAEDEDARIRVEAMEDVVDSVNRDEMIGLLRMVAGDQFRSSVFNSVLDIMGEAHRCFTATPVHAWSKIVPPTTGQLDGRSLEIAIRTLEEIGLPGRNGKPNGHWVKAHSAGVGAIRAGDLEAFLASGLVKPVLTGTLTFQSIATSPAIVDALQPLIDHAKTLVLRRLTEATAAAYQLAARFDEAYQARKRSRRGYRFDDIPRALLEGIDGEDAGGEHGGAASRLEEMYYRLDGRLDHVLLDEFQDTSVVQFRLLEPLIDEILSGGEGMLDRAGTAGAFEAGRTVFCVGDTKQSLYGWRDAEPELLPEIVDRWPQLEREILGENYRSSQIVLDSVNAVFSDLPRLACFETAEDRATAARWSGRFPTHRARRSLSGGVRLTVAPPATPEVEDRTLVARLAARRAAAIVAGAPWATIGVLVRAKSRVPSILAALQREGLNASEETGTPLTDAIPVAVAISMLHLVDHPGDTAARFHVATSPLADIVGLTNWDDDSAADRAAGRIRRSIADDGVAPVLDAWLTALAPSMDAREQFRFTQLISLARTWDEENPAPVRLQPFVERSLTSRVDAPGGSQIRVMTIHGSKGLEFDAVLLPDLDQELVGRTPQLVVARPNPLSADATVSRYPNALLRTLDPALAELAAHWRGRQLNESISVLYVAMTRAKRHLDLFIAMPTKPDNFAKSYAGLLRAALAPAVPLTGDSVIHQLGDDRWMNEPGDPKTHDDPAPDATPQSRSLGEIRLLAASTGSSRSLPRVSPSGLELTPHGPSPVSDAPPRLLDSGIALARGTLFHAWFELIGWLDEEPAPDDESLRRAAAVAAPECWPELAVHAAAFRAALASEAIGAALRRSRLETLHGEGVQLELRRELKFSIRTRGPEGREVLLSGQIDRLCVVRRGGRAIAAEIVDFKTDAISPGTDAAAMMNERYGGQMNAYRRAVEEIFALPSGSIACRLLLVSSGKAVDL